MILRKGYKFQINWPRYRCNLAQMSLWTYEFGSWDIPEQILRKRKNFDQKKERGKIKSCKSWGKSHKINAEKKQIKFDQNRWEKIHMQRKLKRNLGVLDLGVLSLF